MSIVENIRDGANWRHQAACRDEDPEKFFYKGKETSEPARKKIEEAKEICMRCEVRDKCLEWSLASDQEFGVWGGFHEEERRALKSRITRQLGQTAINY